MDDMTKSGMTESRAGRPVACTLSPRELADRRKEIDDLARAALVSSTRLPGAVRLAYRRSDAVEAAVRSLIERERQCCAFLAFALFVEADVLVLDVSGAPEADAMLDAIHAGAARPPA